MDFLSGWPSVSNGSMVRIGDGFGGSSCHSGSRLAGEYCVILLSNELFDGHICLLECNLAPNCYSPMPHTSHIFPISDVACGGTHCEVIVQVSDIDCAATYYDAKCVYYCSGWTLLC